MTTVYFDNHPAEKIDRKVAELAPSGVFVLADSNTAYFVLPRLQDSEVIRKATLITIKAGEMYKDVDTLCCVWKALVDGGANRKSLLINVGGGMVTDLGGFAAATFNRGIGYINIPTTLLGAVDASMGGKTAVNFAGFKNEVGCFYSPRAVIVSADLLSTLNIEDILSGYGEMLKHALLKSTSMTDALLVYNIERYTPNTLLPLIQDSMRVKADVIAKDPYEEGMRKTLNFGHTIGHAFESLSIARRDPIPHGYAVAYGIVAELVLSHTQLAFPSDLLHRVVGYVKDRYGTIQITCNDYPDLFEYMWHDKKNSGDGINFTLLRRPGEAVVDNNVPEDEITAALDIYCDMMM